MAIRERPTQLAAWTKVRKAENDYSRRLRQVATHINNLVWGFVTAEDKIPVDLHLLEDLLNRYSNLLEPWARAVARRFVAEVARRDERAWAIYGKNFSRALEQEIREAPIGDALRQYMDEQVHLITSLPTEAAKRVHEIAIGNLYSGARSTDLVKHILDTGNVTRARANLIARTETARVSSALTMVRAQHVGGTHYFWRTMHDRRVRPAHRKMEGVMVAWATPPEVEPGKHYHAGMFPNCRCYPEPIIPDRYL